ncbi:MAG: Rad52/Rad22 family DNA repair protein [Lewinella sp.]|uniref:Rad52/Rad22 family DNA repair protein n=1 Tax=Lewinella sp. TaxID=2004506 RepID=UPI003D6B772C
MINLELLQSPLEISEIDFRVGMVGKNTKGAFCTILAYKDARVDIRRLNKACGLLGWQKSYSRDNKNCTVSIYDKDNKQWVSKEDTGTESNTEAEKGLASDSFKRACFNWGIGLELYDFPFLYCKLNEDEFYTDGNKAKASKRLRPNNWKWSKEIKADKTCIVAHDGETRRVWAEFKQ